MSLPDGTTAISPGKLAAIATVMEMSPADRRLSSPAQWPDGWQFERVPDFGVDRYLSLFRAVGRDHLWYARLLMASDEIAAAIASATTAIFVLSIEGEDAGFAELDLSEPGSCEIVYFGVVREHIGKGAAALMMERVVTFAFERSVKRLWLHTNTNDHQRAVSFYRRFGFRPVRQFLELAEDPRLTGLYDQSAAPHIPIFRESIR
ncbi:GNAT family N-acetyltransferase [Fulvimarina pelagi]|uniref:GNAT family N-acetyltransferase n=1 Tax=Fulvimarina pelagi TaxID=217511 RepID=UPI0002E52B9B|nr:GNAT family N-acetyltransferase [Fulvimarina pelagi]